MNIDKFIKELESIASLAEKINSYAKNEYKIKNACKISNIAERLINDLTAIQAQQIT